MTHNTRYMTVGPIERHGCQGPLPTNAVSRSSFFVSSLSFQVGTAHFSISSRLKRDTRRLYDRSGDGRNIDPEGGSAEGWLGGGGGGNRRGKGAADVAEKLRQVSQKQPESYQKHKALASK